MANRVFGVFVLSLRRFAARPGQTHQGPEDELGGFVEPLGDDVDHKLVGSTPVLRKVASENFSLVCDEFSFWPKPG